jgi:hypothetical protein
MNKKKILFNKPIYVGQAILDLSKLHMYKFHYSHMKEKFGDRATLMYTDYDSFIHEIQTEYIYRDTKEDEDLYDFSDYPKDQNRINRF